MTSHLSIYKSDRQYVPDWTIALVSILHYCLLHIEMKYYLSV